MDCIFCQIIAGKVQAKKIYEDESVIAILDINLILSIIAPFQKIMCSQRLYEL